jgi:hypothetical protein
MVEPERCDCVTLDVNGISLADQQVRGTTEPADDRSGLSRRTLLAAVPASVVIGSALGTVPSAAALGRQESTPRGLGSGSRGSVGRAQDFVRRMTDAYPVNTGPRIPQSYADGLGLFSTAFIYDVALAVCATLTGNRAARTLAETMGDGIVDALDHDPKFDDGRLRQAYHVGPYVFYDGSSQPHGFIRPDGTVKRRFSVRLSRYRRRRHGMARDRAGPALSANASTPLSAGGDSHRELDHDECGVAGLARRVSIRCRCRQRADRQRVHRTQHRLHVFFGQLHLATRDRQWLEAADRARGFVDKVWGSAGGCFYPGSNDANTINRDPLPLGPQTWSWLALRDRRYARALDWAADALAVTDRSSVPNSQVPPGVFGYFRVQHIGATSWYLMAAARANPMQCGELT